MFRKDTIGVRVYQQAFGSTAPYSTFKDLAFTDASNASANWPTASHALTTINTDGWSANTPTSWNAVTTAPTKPTNRIYDYSRFKITGNKSATVYFNLSYLDTTGANAGNGQYIFNLPSGISFDTSFHPLYSGDNSSTGVDNGTIQMLVYSIPACGFFVNASVDAATNAMIVPYTSTSYRVIYGWNVGEHTVLSSGFGNFFGSRAYKWQFDIVTA
jgi:hypothetical protein